MGQIMGRNSKRTWKQETYGRQCPPQITSHTLHSPHAGQQLSSVLPLLPLLPPLPPLQQRPHDRRQDRRPRRTVRKGQRGQRGQRGQTLIIFALSFTVLLGLAGLTIDVARAYDLYARMQRAAEAGALAGALYLPNYYNSVRPGDTNSAISRAAKEVVKNGFGSLLAPTASACSSTAEVSICQVPGKSNDLVVTIHETLNLVLLSGLGVQPVTLSASGQAEYLPTVQIGSRLNYFGDQVECYNSPNDPDPTQTHSCSPTSSDTHLQAFMATFNGPDDLKEYGDAYVYCEEGLSYSATLSGTTAPYTTYNGLQTNHVQYSDSITNHCGQPTAGLTPGNPDQQPPDYTGEMTKNTSHPGAYNYLISVPAGVGTATLWVFNPSEIPTNVYASTYDHFNGNNPNAFLGPFNTGIHGYTSLHDAPPFYYNVTYSLYQVTSLYDRSSDVLVGSKQTFPPYDGLSADLAYHGCNPASQVYDPYWSGSGTFNSYNLNLLGLGNGCFNLTPGTIGTASPYQVGVPAPCWQAWCQLNLPLNSANGGLYRLAVEATGLSSQTLFYSSGLTSGYGTHQYALKVCAGAVVTPISCADGGTGTTPGLRLSGWNNADLYFFEPVTLNPPDATNPSTTCITTPTPTTPYTCLDLGCIQTAYAGRTVTIQLYDAGDEGANLYIGVAEANGGTGYVSYPGLPNTSLTTIDGDTAVKSSSPTGNGPLNGLWLTAQVTLPPSYTGNCQSGATGTGWWQLLYTGTSVPNDSLTVVFTLAGSPIHLVPPS